MVGSEQRNRSPAKGRVRGEGDTIIRAFVEAGLWALVSITVLLWIILRRFGDVLLTLVPLIMAGVVTLEEAASAIKLVAERNRVIAEGAAGCAVAAAGISVTRAGTAPAMPRRAEIEALLKGAFAP